MNSTASSRLFALLNLWVVTGGILALCLIVLIGWLFAKSYSPHRTWIAQIAFYLGASWVILFAGAIIYALQVSGGIGFESKIYVLVIVVAFESGLLGILGFRSGWRLLGLIPVLTGTYAALPWLMAIASSLKK